jgi:hypothetical protein
MSWKILRLNRHVEAHNLAILLWTSRKKEGKEKEKTEKGLPNQGVLWFCTDTGQMPG